MGEQAGERRCAWCEAVAGPDATACPACGAALAQREDLGGFEIPGVTSVHPALQAAADRPLHIPGSSLSQAAAPGLIGVAALPGAAGLVVGAGLAAVVASEYLGVAGSGLEADHDPAGIGRPSEAALRMVERLESGEGSVSEAPPADVDVWAGNSDNSTRD